MRPLSLDLDHAKRSDSASSDHLNSNASLVSHSNVSTTREPIEATTVDEGDYDANRAPLPAHAPRCRKHDKDRDNLLPQTEICNGQAIVAHGYCANHESFSDGDLVHDASTVTQTGTAKDPLDRLGPGRYDHKGGAACDMTQDSRLEEAAEAQPSKGSSWLNAAWKQPEESICEAEKVTQGPERLGVLQYLATSRDPPRVSQYFACRLSTTVLDILMPARHLCATEHKSSPYISSTARETQVHELDDAIPRLMPSNRTICFGVDGNSFKLGGVPDKVTNLIICAAQMIVSIVERENLGINFSYCPNSASNVFDLCYDQSLEWRTLARAFFPGDSRIYWKLRISKRLAFSRSLREYLPNVLAHEFMHILGLRHWNAGTCETEERSFQWPNTIWQSRNSVMITGVHPSRMRFFPEDFRVVREIYSHDDGDVVDGREIIDVHP